MERAPKLFFHLPKTLLACFYGSNLLIQLLAFVLTYLIVVTGFDWGYFLATRGTLLKNLFFPAVIVGGVLPLFGLPLLLLIAYLKKALVFQRVVWMLGQAALLGWSVSTFYKVFTGRLQPNLHDQLIDISHTFRFGVLRGGAFWGWPSSHTSVAFAMALALVWTYRKQRIVPILAMIYACYIGIGVATVGIHWLSEAVAGALIGGVIGFQVGKNFERHSS